MTTTLATWTIDPVHMVMKRLSAGRQCMSRKGFQSAAGRASRFASLRCAARSALRDA
jgi:hypothetical protein